MVVYIGPVCNWETQGFKIYMFLWNFLKINFKFQNGLRFIEHEDTMGLPYSPYPVSPIINI